MEQRITRRKLKKREVLLGIVICALYCFANYISDNDSMNAIEFTSIGFSAIALVIKGIVFVLSLFGYGLFCRQKIDVREELLPIIVITSLSSVLYVAGILNFIELMTYIIMLGGIALFVYNLPQLDLKITANRMIFLTLIIYLIYFCYGAVYADGDTMTHWGVIVREMLEVNRLPNFTTQEVAYQSYPPGTAVWIYYVCKVVGYTEGATLFAQGLIVCSSLITMFVFAPERGAKENRTVSILRKGVLLGVVIYLLQYNIRMDSLQVDHVLSVLCIAGLCTVFSTQRNPKQMFIAMMPLLLYIPIVKNIGIMYAYVLVVAMACCYLGKKQIEWPTKVMRFALYTLLPTVVFTFLWNCHIGMVYRAADMTRHSASLSYMASVADSKSIEELQTIANNYFNVWFSMDPKVNATREWWLLISTVIISAVGKAVLFVLKKEKGYTGVFLTSIIGLYCVYKILLLCMYMFNMPDEDAIYIGAYQRYMEGILAIMFFLLVVYGIHIAETVWESKMRIQSKAFIVVIAFATLCIYPMMHTAPFTKIGRPDYHEDGLYRQLKVVKEENNLPEKGAKVLVYTKTPYSGFFIQYCFRSQDAWGVAVSDFERAMEETPDFYDYLIVIDPDEEIENAINKYGYDLERMIYLREKNGIEEVPCV